MKMPTHRPFKRPTLSDQRLRREAALDRQSHHRADAQRRARLLTSSLLDLMDVQTQPEALCGDDDDEFTIVEASRMKGAQARRWFSRQLMLPEWMVDLPSQLDRYWYVIPRPAGKRCFVVSCNGCTISRLRNGSVLHCFPSLLPNGARTQEVSGPASTHSILDCIFHEPDQTYYVIDVICWNGCSFYECEAEFRFSWLKNHLIETGVCNPPSTYHRFRFSVIPAVFCDEMALARAYAGTVPYVTDGLLFYNKHAHYQSGNTPLALVWKDAHCSQYFLDTDSKGQVPSQQQSSGATSRQDREMPKLLRSRPINVYSSKLIRIVLELQDDGKLITSDDPPVVIGCLDAEVIQKFSSQPGHFLRFCIRDENVRFANRKMEFAHLEFTGKANRARAFADSYSKILFQYAAWHSPLRLEDLIASIQLSGGSSIADVDMTD